MRETLSSGFTESQSATGLVPLQPLTVDVDLTCPARDGELFGISWADAFCRCWNEGGMKNHPFSAIGAVKFEVTQQSGTVSTMLFWDDAGMVSQWTGSEIDVPCFSGLFQAWATLICGERTAVASVHCKALIYRGPILFAIRNGHKFDRVAEVARQITNLSILTGEMK